MSRRNMARMDFDDEMEERRGPGIVLFTPYVRRLLIAGVILWLTTYHTYITGNFDTTKIPQTKVDSVLYTIYGIVGSIVTYELVKWFAD